MDISQPSLGNILSQDDVQEFPLPFISQDCHDLQLYKYILQLFLQDLSKSDFLFRDVPKPRSF